MPPKTLREVSNPSGGTSPDFLATGTQTDSKSSIFGDMDHRHLVVLSRGSTQNSGRQTQAGIFSIAIQYEAWHDFYGKPIGGK